MIKGAIFDMDGLLFDTEHVYHESWEMLAPAFGTTYNPEFKYAVAGTSGESMLQRVKEYYPETDAEAYMKAVLKRVDEQMSKYVRKMKGVDELLAFFQKNEIRMAVASSSTIHQIKQNLTLANIREYFDVITSGQEVKNGKPAPDIFLLSASRLGYAPEECYVFEDSVNGMLAGITAGCHSIMIPDMFPPTDEVQKHAYGIYSSLSDFLDTIK